MKKTLLANILTILLGKFGMYKYSGKHLFLFSSRVQVKPFAWGFSVNKSAYWQYLCKDLTPLTYYITNASFLCVTQCPLSIVFL